jgi:hypothetical protein
MFKKINNKILLLIFVVLAALVVYMLIDDNKKGERTFKSELFIVDSAKVDKITIYPKGKNKSEINLIKTGKSWEIKNNNKTFPADTMVIQNILQTLSNVKTIRVAGTDKSTWKEFEITDTSATRVVVEQDKEITADFRYGKISYSQNRQSQYYGGNRNVSVNSYIRLAGDDKVYVVDGFFPMVFSNQVSQFRIKTVFRFDKNLLTKLTFIYPGDSSFVLMRKENKWLMNEQPVDSAITESFINSLANTNNSDFADDLIHFPSVSHRLIIDGNNMNPIEVKGVADTLSKKYYLNSSFNSSVNFCSDNPYLFNNIFVSASKFKVKKDSDKKNKTGKK